MNKSFIVNSLILVPVILLSVIITPTLVQASQNIVLPQASTVVVTFISSEAGDNNLFGISSPVSQVFGYGRNVSRGTNYNLVTIASGSELVFYITNGKNETFYSGATSGNSDGVDHARITSLGTNQWQVGLEDTYGGGDKDYNDIVIKVTISATCTARFSQKCVGNSLYWFDSCDVQGELSQQCATNQTCQNAQCTSVACTYHYQQRCSGNDLYWYDSCGNRQGVAQYCQNGCYNDSCQNYYNYNYNYNYGYNSCTYHAYKLCVGGNVYWFSGCNQQQDLAQSCSVYGQACQYGQCTNYTNVIIQPIQPTYNPYHSKACYNGSIYWYDSLGAVSGLYQNCNDNNSCTQDTCSTNACQNTLKCDGSTCVTTSTDYTSRCPAVPITPTAPTTPTPTENPCGNNVCEPDLGETSTTCSNDCITTTPDQNQAAAAISETPAKSGIIEFLEKYYVWILGIIVLIFFFILVFKRFSSDV